MSLLTTSILLFSVLWLVPFALSAQSFLEKLGQEAKETLLTETAQDVSGTAGARGLGDTESTPISQTAKKPRRKRVVGKVKETLETKTAQDVSGTAGVRGLTLQPETTPKKSLLKTD